LLKYECEIFVQIGTWKNIEDLEENITLHELFLLYRACNHELNKRIKVAALAQGADVDFEEDWYDLSSRPEEQAIEERDIKYLGIGLGYEKA
jgi:hypothetical protein